MAKKIIIDFSAQPITTGIGFEYSLSVNGFEVYYNSGETDVVVNYIPLGGVPVNVNELPIGASLEQTIQKTLDFLQANYISDLVFYNIVENTIEVLVNADASVTINPLINANIDITSQEVEPGGINLIYFLIYGIYRLNIYKKNYNGGSTEIYGNITINKSSVTNILEPIRGTGLDISLEANQSVTFDEFLLSDEFTYKTELLKNDLIIYNGYIKPDGVQQSFIDDFWFVNIASTDGLGALKDLSFVQENGLHFTGKMSFYEIIKACLDRTKLDLTINTSIGLEYTGYSGTNVLKDIYVNSERFIKDGDDTVVSDCNDVLTSILNLCSAIITQQDGQWWICRPNDFTESGLVNFINQDTNATFTKNLFATLGSQINNFYPHHCENNQQIEVKGAISAYRLNYQYGFKNSILNNSDLNHDEDLNYDGWTVNPSLPSGILINDPNDLSGVIMKPKTYTLIPPIPGTTLEDVITSNPLTVEAGSLLNFYFNVRTKYRKQNFYFIVETSDGFFLTKKGTWSSSNEIIAFSCGNNTSASDFFTNIEIKANEVPNNCDITITIYRPSAKDTLFNGLSGLGEVLKVAVLDITLSEAGIVGENHTVSRKLPPSSITKENQKVYNGDGDRTLIGSIYKNDLVSFTDTWNRKGKTEMLPILGISAMDDLRIQSSPVKVFSGSVYGEIDYLSVLKIDNVIGLFMATEWKYNINTNVLSAKFMQFYNIDLADILYEISPDYGKSTIKPTIKG